MLKYLGMARSMLLFMHIFSYILRLDNVTGHWACVLECCESLEMVELIALLNLQIRVTLFICAAFVIKLKPHE